MKDKHSLVPDFAKLHIAVLGDVMLDSYWSGNAERVSPEAPVPVVKVDSKQYASGGAANVARNITALGAKCTLIGVVGDDNTGEILQQILVDKKINNKLLVASGKTTQKLRVQSSGQQLLRIDFEEKASSTTHGDLLDRLQAILQDIDILILSDYAKGVLSEPQQFIKLAKAAGIPVLVDPKNKNSTLYSGATVLTPNWKEYSALVPHAADDVELEYATTIRKDCNVDAILITRGPLGMSLVTDKIQHIQTEAQEVFDVTGAGDTVIAVLALGLASGLDYFSSAKLANTAAGIVVSKHGAATTSISELFDALKNVDLEGAVVTVEQCVKLLEPLRQSGKKIVFTNGCFDILHPGHIKYLEAAAKLGDCLVVALNSDDSVRRLKGEARPLNNLAARSACVSGLRSVDWVVSFGEDTPLEVIKRISPHVLVKGGDYNREDIIGADFVLDGGGSVKVIDFVAGFSTTTLLEKIDKRGG